MANYVWPDCFCMGEKPDYVGWEQKLLTGKILFYQSLGQDTYVRAVSLLSERPIVLKLALVLALGDRFGRWAVGIPSISWVKSSSCLVKGAIKFLICSSTCSCSWDACLGIIISIDLVSAHDRIGFRTMTFAPTGRRSCFILFSVC